MRHAATRMPMAFRVLIGLVGLGSLMGSLAYLAERPKDWWFGLAGGVVSLVWLVVAALGTLPLRVTVRAEARQLPDEERWAAGLATIRRRDRQARWAIVVWMPVGIGVLALGYPTAALVVLVVGALISGILNGLYIQSACPRCGHGFFALPRGRGMLAWPTRHCRHCGLRQPGT